MGLAVAPRLSVAQGGGVLSYRELDTTTMVGGLRQGQYNFGTRRGQATVAVLEADFSGGRLLAELVTPNGGLHTPEELQLLATRAGSRAALGLVRAPAIDATNVIAGLYYNRGQIFSWPPVGHHLLLRPEGTLRVAEPEAGIATISFDASTSFTLVSLNGPLPSQRGEAALLTGPLTSGQLPQGLDLSGLMFLRLRPTATGADPTRLLAAEETGAVWQPVAWQDSRTLRVEGGEVALATTSDHADWVRDAALRRPLATIRIPLPPQVREASVVFPLGREIIRASQPVAAAADQLWTNVVALDATATRLMVISAPDVDRRNTAVPTEVLVDFMQQQGLVEAWAVESGTMMLLPDASRRDRWREAATARMRLGIGFREGTEALRVPEVSGDLERLTRVRFDPIGAVLPLNAAAAVGDLRAGFHGSLSHFWGAPFLPTRETGIQMYLWEPRRVALVEVVHVSAAGFSPEFSLRAYRLEGRLNTTQPYRTLAAVRHDVPKERDRIVLEAPVPLGDIRLIVEEPSFLPAGNVARLAELYLWALPR
jgi:hypothetical protein